MDSWLKENIIDNLMHGREDNDYNTHYWFHWGNSEFIKEKLLNWLSKFETVEWVSDVCHYDFVLLINLLFKSALNIPIEHMSASCYDINQDIARFYNISQNEAFDKSREEILTENGIWISGDKHNALYDAFVIRAIFNIIENK